jgi:hypothetical protein
MLLHSVSFSHFWSTSIACPLNHTQELASRTQMDRFRKNDTLCVLLERHYFFRAFLLPTSSRAKLSTRFPSVALLPPDYQQAQNLLCSRLKQDLATRYSNAYRTKRCDQSWLFLLKPTAFSFPLLFVPLKSLRE